MARKIRQIRSVASAKCCFLLLAVMLAVAVTVSAQDRNPVILIPGLTGSELRDKKTGERVWFKTRKSKSEDLRLPISTDITKMADGLEATDILREVKIGPFPVTDVYGGFIKAMEQRGGYREESWTEPGEDGHTNALYVFAYDWRLDNVVNARLLVRTVERLKKRLGKPDLKFDVVAHSMGGIIARYAVMYGDSDLPTGRRAAKPAFAGSKHFDKVILLGTPNEGSALALNALLNGFSIGGLRIDLPWAQDTSKFAVFTIPSLYQLLPAPGTAKIYNDELQPVSIDIYDPQTWNKYGWSVMQDKKFSARFSRGESRIAERYLAAALARARQLHEALAAANGESGHTRFYPVGADCKSVLDGIVFVKEEDGKWKTLLKAKGFKRSDGQKVADADIREVIQSPGDGVVAARSLEASTQAAKLGLSSIYSGVPTKFFCEDHNKLAANSRIQDYVISVLAGKIVDNAEIGKK